MDKLDQRYLTDLVRRAKTGGSNAFAELFAAVGPHHYAYLCGMLEDERKAGEVLEECMLSIFRGLPALSKPELYMPWACRICFQHGRDEADSNVPTPAGTYSLSQILQLPIAESQVLLMRYGQNFPLAETADLLNFSLGLTRRILREGLKRLQRILPEETEVRTDTKHMSVRQKKWPRLDPQRAAAILENVIRSGNHEENTVPIEALSSYAVYRRERFSLQRGILIALLVLFFLLPGLFLLPRLECSIEETGIRGLPVYSFQVRTILPVRSVTARVRSRSIPVYEDSAKSFTVEPTRNGKLSVVVELANRQQATVEEIVTQVDSTSPELLESRIGSDYVILTVRDAGIGVCYSEIYALTGGGEKIFPLATDAETGEVRFAVPHENWDIYIPDYIGNTLHLAVTLQ